VMGRLKVGSSYHPQQSVLNPHFGHRQTACIRYISAFPQRSQIIRSSCSARSWPATTRSAGGASLGTWESAIAGIIFTSNAHLCGKLTFCLLIVHQ
jgi:hypothetical protein